MRIPWRPLLALIRKDLAVFLTDRHAVVLSFLAPICLASFMAAIFGGAGKAPPSKIPIRIVDEDKSPATRRIWDKARGDELLDPVRSDRDGATADVRKGRAVVALILPEGFGEAASESVLGDPDRPELTFLHDPTRQSDLSLVRGLLTRIILESVTADSLEGTQDDALVQAMAESDPGLLPSQNAGEAEFLDLLKDPNADELDRQSTREALAQSLPGLADLLDDEGTSVPSPLTLSAPTEKAENPGFTLPYESREVSITSGGDQGERSALAGHAFAGMVVQFVLFSAIEWGVGLINERRKGLWKRLRSAPVSCGTLVASKVLGCAIVSGLITLVVFGFGALTFGVRLRGSPAGFLAMAAAYSFTASTFGLMVASLGRTPQAARSVAILAVLVMVLLGGGWIPSFLFPQWLQDLTPAIPTRWAIDGFDGVLSRGFTFAESLPGVAALLGFSAAFGLVATVRCRWDEV